MTPSPVLWGQEKFRDTNNASDGFGKWFARIVAGSVRQLPYSLRVDGRTTYIDGYSYTPTGTQEPTVGNDWYPVVLDEFDNQEYASVDAYIASENGKATLQGCGVSALVPLETAIQRLAENGINITVHKKGLYRRYNGGSYGVLVDGSGRTVVNKLGGNNYVFRSTSNTDVVTMLLGSDQTVSEVVQEFGIGTELSFEPDPSSHFVVDGITYTILTQESSEFTISPNPPAWE